ncbi:hypothetical protein [Bdellovibrio svalbardensis]|uniref:Uncharacterized protein n=1 Tax=Bdellovibrio svalbardensis TaxID=2972972 RepID=A0ABT6DMP8_9BACT|nr:hypothetical protein [Bdellovibrio svalbardensis]MDG0818138.1 hypothetical protein [Bdellovibrio svalbardensis]
MNVIEIHIKEVPQLFDSRDPAPFHERDLDSSFANYLIACAEESKTRSKYFRIQIDIDERHPTIDEEKISAAIHSYFKYQIELKRLEFTRTMRMARLFLLFGLIILFLCLSIAQILQNIESDFIKTSLREGVVIFGWVSLWKPLEVFLFDWYPIYDKIRLYRKIFASQINILFNAKETL